MRNHKQKAVVLEIDDVTPKSMPLITLKRLENSVPEFSTAYDLVASVIRSKQRGNLGNVKLVISNNEIDCNTYKWAGEDSPREELEDSVEGKADNASKQDEEVLKDEKESVVDSSPPILLSSQGISGSDLRDNADPKRQKGSRCEMFFGDRGTLCRRCAYVELVCNDGKLLRSCKKHHVGWEHCIFRMLDTATL